MILTYTLTLENFKAAEKLHINQRFSRQIGYGMMYIGIPVLAVLGLIGFYYFNIGAKSDLSLGYSIIEVILISQAIFIPIERSKRLRRPLKAKCSSGEVVPKSSIEIDEKKILSETQGRSKIELTWDAIVEAAQDENVAMLYVNDKDFILIPTRAFSPPERAEFRDLVARHIPVGKP